jgi:hypothetical protein
MAEPFPESVVEEAWNISGGKCECTRKTHYHTGRCNKELIKKNRGKRGELGCWEPHHKISTGEPVLSNCEILCCKCHYETF